MLPYVRQNCEHPAGVMSAMSILPSHLQHPGNAAVVLEVKCVVSRVTSEKVLKNFSSEPRVVSTQQAVGATRQANLSKLVKAVWRFTTSNSPDLLNYKHTETDKRTHGSVIRLLIQYIEIRNRENFKPRKLSVLPVCIELISAALVKYAASGGQEIYICWSGLILNQILNNYLRTTTNQLVQLVTIPYAREKIFVKLHFS